MLFIFPAFIIILIKIIYFLIEPVRNNHFGYIFQNYYLLKDYSVNYNVKIALNRYNLSEKEKDKRTKYILLPFKIWLNALAAKIDNIRLYRTKCKYVLNV